VLEIEMHSISESSFFDDTQVPCPQGYHLLHEQCSLFWLSASIKRKQVNCNDRSPGLYYKLWSHLDRTTSK
jgi:hypothetical protein